MSSISASVSSPTPLPWETLATGTSQPSASASTASRQRGPSTLGISTRDWAPSGNRRGRRLACRAPSAGREAETGDIAG